MLSSQLGIIDVRNVSSVFWPLILIAVGAQRLYKIGRFNIGGAVMVLFGMIFEIEALHLVPYSAEVFIAPCMIIIVGISLLFPRRKAFNR